MDQKRNYSLPSKLPHYHVSMKLSTDLKSRCHSWKHLLKAIKKIDHKLLHDQSLCFKEYQLVSLDIIWLTWLTCYCYPQSSRGEIVRVVIDGENNDLLFFTLAKEWTSPYCQVNELFYSWDDSMIDVHSVRRVETLWVFSSTLWEHVHSVIILQI